MRIVLLGASRGLGHSTKKVLEKRGAEVFSFSRSTLPSVDFSKMDRAPQAIHLIQEKAPQKIIYLAGGGPFGEFGRKEFKDHEWALKVNFLFPAFLLHQVLSRSSTDWSALQQICFIGSAIAESRPDAMASSYSAAKHALKGLVTSVQAEPHGHLDVRLYSPGYMDSDMLPKNAWPRQGGAKVFSPEIVAENLATWLENPDFTNQHQVFE